MHVRSGVYILEDQCQSQYLLTITAKSFDLEINVNCTSSHLFYFTLHCNIKPLMFLIQKYMCTHSAQSSFINTACMRGSIMNTAFLVVINPFAQSNSSPVLSPQFLQELTFVRTITPQLPQAKRCHLGSLRAVVFPLTSSPGRSPHFVHSLLVALVCLCFLRP